jgi:hypothetical protein
MQDAVSAAESIIQGSKAVAVVEEIATLLGVVFDEGEVSDFRSWRDDGPDHELGSDSCVRDEIAGQRHRMWLDAFRSAVQSQPRPVDVVARLADMLDVPVLVVDAAAPRRFALTLNLEGPAFKDPNELPRILRHVGDRLDCEPSQPDRDAIEDRNGHIVGAWVVQ